MNQNRELATAPLAYRTLTVGGGLADPWEEEGQAGFGLGLSPVLRKNTDNSTLMHKLQN